MLSLQPIRASGTGGTSNGKGSEALVLLPVNIVGTEAAWGEVVAELEHLSVIHPVLRAEHGQLHDQPEKPDKRHIRKSYIP